MTLRPCLGPPSGGDCPTHELVRDADRCGSCRPTTTTRGLGSSYQQLARHVIATEAGCHICGRTDLTEGDIWTADHVVPRSRGGRLVRSNLRKAHRSCNSSKGATSDRVR